MALPSFARLTVIVRRAGVTEDHGGQVEDWGTPADHDITGCMWEPSAGQEFTDRRIATSGAGVLFLPPDADILATDHVVVHGDEYTVQGRPQRVDSASGALDHVLATLLIWEG